jgi:hypothetical protein
MVAAALAGSFAYVYTDMTDLQCKTARLSAAPMVLHILLLMVLDMSVVCMVVYIFVGLTPSSGSGGHWCGRCILLKGQGLLADECVLWFTRLCDLGDEMS